MWITANSTSDAGKELRSPVLMIRLIETYRISSILSSATGLGKEVS
jgi:hypothetical protein